MAPITTRTRRALAHLTNALALLAGIACGSRITIIAGSPVVGDDSTAIAASGLTRALTLHADARAALAFVVIGIGITIIARKAFARRHHRRATADLITRHRLALRLSELGIAR